MTVEDQPEGGRYLTVSKCETFQRAQNESHNLVYSGYLHEASKQIYFNFWTKNYSSFLSFAYIVLKYLLKVEDFLRTNQLPIIKTFVESAILIVGEKKTIVEQKF